MPATTIPLRKRVRGEDMVEQGKRIGTPNLGPLSWTEVCRWWARYVKRVKKVVES
jgi:hypothetical protein